MAGSESSHVLVLGGGFAGLSCAAALAEAGLRPLVLERRPHLGGRAYSFAYPKTGETVDNGQHLLLACYGETRAFLRRIGSGPLLRLAPSVRLDFAEPGGFRESLRCPAFLPAPFHLAAGVLGLAGLSVGEILDLRHLHYWLRKNADGGVLPRHLDKLTCREWLGSLGLGPRVQERLIDPITIGALNEVPERASALGLAQVLREAFYREGDAARPALPTVGLSELYAEPARRFIQERGGRVVIGTRVVSLRREGNAWEAVSALGERFRAPRVVSSLPPWALKAVERPAALRGPWEGWPTAPVIGINLWLDRPVVDEDFIGLLRTQTHWVFNKTRLWRRPEAITHLPTGLGTLGLRPRPRPAGGQQLSVVISGAHRHVTWLPRALFQLAIDELRSCFPAAAKARITAWSVVKEPYATPSPVPGSDAWRPAHASPAPDFFYAGDWTQTGLPATIESAVKSGHACARLVLEAGR